jgi:hypothetical protein
MMFPWLVRQIFLEVLFSFVLFLFFNEKRIAGEELKHVMYAKCGFGCKKNLFSFIFVEKRIATAAGCY